MDIQKCPKCGKEKSDNKTECSCGLNWRFAKINQDSIPVLISNLEYYKEIGAEKIKWMTANDKFVCSICKNIEGIHPIGIVHDLIINTHKLCKSDFCRCCITAELE